MSEITRNIILMAMNIGFAAMNYSFWHFLETDFSLWACGFCCGFIALHAILAWDARNAPKAQES